MPAPARKVPPPFSDEPTRQVDNEILNALRSGQMPNRPPLPPPAFNDEPTRMAPPMNLNDMRAFGDDTGPEGPTGPMHGRFPQQAPATDPAVPGIEQYPQDEATSIASLDGIAAMERARHSGNNDERTRAVNIRNDPSISDIDWDLD
jgi:hypothetical protein